MIVSALDHAEDSTAKTRSHPSTGRDGGGGMRVIVPLQGVLQGRGGLILGSIIPCALFYFLQLYLKRNRAPPPSASSHPSSPDSGSPPSSPHRSSWGNLAELPRSHSRTLLCSKGSSWPVTVSDRASEIAKDGGDSLYYVGSRRCKEDLYDPVWNPEGVAQLGLAENKLSMDLLWEWIDGYLRTATAEPKGKPDLCISRLVTYQPFDGMLELKIAIASFMDQVMQGSVSFLPMQLILTAGATSAIEILSFCLADPGNGFLVPTPCCPGFDCDIKCRTGVDLIPVPCRSTDNFKLSVAALERAYNEAKNRGIKVRAVFVSNPSNPVGGLLDRELMFGLLDFVREKNIHLISDELFAGSTYGDSKFVSMAEILDSDDLDKSRVHIIYGLSKDLCLPGFRVGAIYSYNKNVLAAATRLSRFSPVSAPTQHLLVSMLSDTKFIDNFLHTNKMRLQKMHKLFADGLKQIGIECSSSSGGFYCWADLSKFIRSYSEKGELELWDKLLNVSKINVTPGSACNCIEPGWFRCCFTTLTEEDIPVVMDRFKRVIEIH